MKSAFTLIEIIIVIALFAIVVLIGAPLSQSNLNSSELDTALEVSLSSLRIAQSYSISGNNDSQWSVRFNGNKVVVFKGSVYASRDTAFDIETIFSNKIVFSGVSEITFSKMRGMPNNTGIITIGTTDRSRNININNVGMFDY